MNIDAYNARTLIAQAITEERSRIIAELTDAAQDIHHGVMEPLTVEPLMLLWLTDAIAIVRGEAHP